MRGLRVAVIAVALQGPLLYAAPAQNCSATLQSLVDSTPAGGVLDVPPCVYRETVTLGRPITMDGHGQAEIRGSDVWSTWSPSGSSWVSALTVPPLGDERPYLSDGRCGSPTNPTPACASREQVFADGLPVPFTLDSARHVVLPTDPAGRTIEVTTRARWLRTAANGVTVRGFTMRHSGAGFQVGAASNDGYDNWTISDSTLRDTHGAVVEVNQGRGTQVLRNDISGSGEVGVGGFTSSARVEANTIHGNGTLASAGWGAAGVKLDGSGITLVGNDVYANPFGVWCDVHCTNWVVQNNDVHDNTQDGVQFEISDGATIKGNRIWSNGWGRTSWLWGAGVLIQSSANADVSGNVIAWNFNGVSIVILTRPDRPASMAGDRVSGNLILRETSPTTYWWNNGSIGSGDDSNGADLAANPPSVSGNRFWIDRAEAFPPVRFTWKNTSYWQLAAFKAASADAVSRYATDAEALAALAGTRIPPRSIGRSGTQTPVPTALPTQTATPLPTGTPTVIPTKVPTLTPTAPPTGTPTQTATVMATATPTSMCKVQVLDRGTPKAFSRKPEFCRDEA